MQSAAGAFLKGFVMIVVSTDGSALGNPNGSMGWAWADHTDEAGSTHEHQHAGNADAGGATNGTNQIGELCAVLEALRAHPGSEDLTIETDSQYAINCSTTWIHGWKKNGWKNSKKEPVKNADLIRAIDSEITKREGSVKFVWVKGHAGNAGNEKVDELARTYAEDCRSRLKDGYLPLEGWKSLISSTYADGVDVPEDAKMLLDGKISNAEYHIGRCVGKDINPDFKGDFHRETKRETSDDDAIKYADNSVANDSTTRNSNTQDESKASDESRKNKQSQNKSEQKYQVVPGLCVSGTLQFTPAPNTSQSFNGQPRYVLGNIQVSGYVQPDGTLKLDPTEFYIQTKAANQTE
ncbi:ribonuclease HI [Gardnerella vaginalis JCP7276]|nr:ribonuclease HI [Gardnerella vaginalis JCP7276]